MRDLLALIDVELADVVLGVPRQVGQRDAVFTREQILDHLYGPKHAVSDRAVDVQIVGLRRKLGPAGKYIETVRGVGYRFRE